MRTAIKLLIAAVVIYGSWRTGMVYWRYYQFRDAVQAAVQFAGGKSDQAVQETVLQIASTMQISVAPEEVRIRRENNRTFVSATYADQIDFLPTYRYPLEFHVNVNVYTVTLPVKAGDMVP